MIPPTEPTGLPGRRGTILVTASTFPAGALDGSRPRFVYDLAEALAAHARVLALAPEHPGAARRERMGSVEVVRFRYWRPSRAQRLTPNMREQLRASWLARLQVPFFLLAQALCLRRLVARHGVECVNAHWLVPQGLVAALLRGRRRPRFRLVLHVHAGDVYLLARLPGGRALARYVLARCDDVLADGSHVRDTLDDLLEQPSGATIQPMGVSRGAFGARSPSSGAVAGAEDFPEGFILFVGRFVEKKGVAHLIRALPSMLRRHPELGLLLVGSGPEEASLREEVRALGLEENVRFLGARSHAEVAAALRGCRVAAVPSIVDRYGETEGMPTVVLEALAAGVRVVGSAVDGIPDVIRHAENGWLCRQKDPEDLAAKLLEALDDPADSAVLRDADRTVARFDWPAVGRRYIEKLRP